MINVAQAPHGSTQSLGVILGVRGGEARVAIPVAQARATVGDFVRIYAGARRLIGMITEVETESAAIAPQTAVARVEMMGEFGQDGNGRDRFRRGVSAYPAIGDAAGVATREDLKLIYEGAADGATIGVLHHDETIPARICMSDMLPKHFAVLGSTGVGKSSGVAVILNGVLDAAPNVRVFLLDGHNEFAHCFGARANVVHPQNLKLPFWLFNFEEIVDVLFGGRPGVPEELEVLAEVIPLAKGMYSQYQKGDRIGLKRETRSGGYAVDTPVPYRLVDLISLIDERMGKLENRSSRMVYYKLISRIEIVRNDPRYTFMFDNANVGGDTMAEVISHLFRLPANGKPMTVMQLAGFPAEVVDSVVSVLCRMAFDFGLWSDGVSPVLFVCEEAHRYASADRSIGFGPTRKAISRIAKEGRKYGVYLGLITQRPAELDATIISQCNTLFSMRLANERDQALMRSAVSDAAANLLSFVPSLGTREVLAFGEGVALPTRLRFKEVPPHQLPRSEATIATVPSVTAGHDAHFVGAVVERWRGATTSRDAPSDSTRSLSSVEAPMLQPSQGFDPDRFSLLKKPLR